MILSLAFLLLTQSSLSLTPLSTTLHFAKKNPSSFLPGSYPGKEVIRIKGRQLNVHPQLILNFSAKYFQLSSGVIFYDTEGKPAFPLVLGPKFDISESLTIGAVLGAEVRQSHFPPGRYTFGPRKFYSTGDDFGPGRRGSYEILPIGGITTSYALFGCLQIQGLLTPELLNLGVGVILF